MFGHEKVSVLNGGLPKWIKEGRPVESGETKVEPVTYKVPTLRQSLVRDYAAVLANVRRVQQGAADTAQVLDARPEARFTGEAPEPRPGLSSGHMPGSISVPFNLVIEDGQLLPDDKLKDVFAAKGVDFNKEIVNSCGAYKKMKQETCGSWNDTLENR